MISINRSDILVAMLPGMATADKQRIFLAKLDATLPKGDDETGQLPVPMTFSQFSLQTMMVLQLMTSRTIKRCL